jgi:hypothetical protein
MVDKHTDQLFCWGLRCPQTEDIQEWQPNAIGGSEGPPRSDDTSISSVQQNFIVTNPLNPSLDAQVVEVATGFPGSSWSLVATGKKLK